MTYKLRDGILKKANSLRWNMTEKNTDCLVVTVAEAGQMLGLSRGSAYLAVHQRQIPSLRIGRRILVPRVALQKLLDEGQYRQNDVS